MIKLFVSLVQYMFPVRLEWIVYLVLQFSETSTCLWKFCKAIICEIILYSALNNNDDDDDDDDVEMMALTVKYACLSHILFEMKIIFISDWLSVVLIIVIVAVVVVVLTRKRETKTIKSMCLKMTWLLGDFFIFVGIYPCLCSCLLSLFPFLTLTQTRNFIFCSPHLCSQSYCQFTFHAHAYGWQQVHSRRVLLCSIAFTVASHLSSL